MAIELRKTALPGAKTIEEEIKEVQEVTQVVVAGKTAKFKFKLPPKKTLLILGLVLVVLVTISVLIKILQKPAGSLPAITPTPTEEPKIASPSAYATDSAVLKIEKNLDEIEVLLKETGFRQPALLPPEVDLGVEFELED